MRRKRLGQGSQVQRNLWTENSCRLRDEVRAKQREADKQGQEITTLKSALVSKEHAMKAAAAAAEKISERVLKAEGRPYYSLRLLYCKCLNSMNVCMARVSASGLLRVLLASQPCYERSREDVRARLKAEGEPLLPEMGRANVNQRGMKFQ